MKRLALDVPKLLAELGVTVRKSGSELRGRCPNPKHTHSGRPGPGTWQIVPAGERAGQHVCHSCGWGGGAVALVQAVKGFEDGKAAWRWLLEFCGETVPDGARIRIERKVQEQASQTLDYPEGSVALWEDPLPSEVEPALRYLEGRGVTLEEIRRYGMAAVPIGAPKYSARVIVPVIVRGAMVDFVARLYVKASALIPKALSGRKDLGARKELALWGYDHLDPRLPVVHVVEGVWGALAMIRAGIPNVVAACGSNWTPERSELLAAWPRIVLIPDGDPAGAKLEQRAASLRFRARVEVVDLPEKAQPDTVSVEELRAFLAARREARFGIREAVRIGTYGGKITSREA